MIRNPEYRELFSDDLELMILKTREHFKLTQASRNHLERELSSVEQILAGITRMIVLEGQ